MNKIENTISYVIGFFILVTTTYVFGAYSNDHVLQYIAIGVMDIILIYNELFLISYEKRKQLIIAEGLVIGIVFVITLMESGYIYYSYYFISIFQISRCLKIKIASIISALIYVLTIISIKSVINNPTELWTHILVTTGIFTMSLIIVFLIAYVINQNRIIEEAKKKILHESLKREYAYEQLQIAYDKLENYTVLKERNNISREMHDTVGHNLTVALVELENFGIDKVNENDKKEFKYITERVRKSLYDLRTTVHKLKDDINFEVEIDNLITNICIQKLAKITYSKDNISNIKSEILKCIYRIIQESITNGIKHGQATAFIIAIKLIGGNIVVRVINNGNGANAFKKGFGLNAMTERVNELEGSLDIESDKDNGFTITAYIPIMQ